MCSTFSVISEEGRAEGQKYYDNMEKFLTTSRARVQSLLACIRGLIQRRNGYCLNANIHMKTENGEDQMNK